MTGSAFLDDKGRCCKVEQVSSTDLRWATFWADAAGARHRVRRIDLPMAESEEEAQRDLDRVARIYGWTPVVPADPPDLKVDLGGLMDGPPPVQEPETGAAGQDEAPPAPTNPEGLADPGEIQRVERLRGRLQEVVEQLLGAKARKAAAMAISNAEIKAIEEDLEGVILKIHEEQRGAQGPPVLPFSNPASVPPSTSGENDDRTV